MCRALKVLCVAGDAEALAALKRAAREAYPFLRIVADRDLPGATVVATSLAGVRSAIKGLPRPGGPVGSRVSRTPRGPSRRPSGPSGSRR